MLPVFDGHNDALTHEDYADLATGRSGGHLDLPRMREGGMRGGIFVIFTPSPEERSGPRRFGGQAYREPPAKPLEQGAAAAHATAAAEGAEAIDPGLEALDQWYAAGLRSLGPVWSRANAFAHGVTFEFPSSPDVGPGLTDTPAGPSSVAAPSSASSSTSAT